MVEIYLPFFYENFKYNQLLIDMVNNHIDWLKSPLKISGVYGNFPYTPCNGGFNNNFGDRGLYRDFVNTADQSTMPVFFDCSNLLLEENDYEDVALNLILSLNDSGSNWISVSSTRFGEFLKNRYPNYHYLFSGLGDLIYPMDNSIINQLTQHYDAVELPITYNFSEVAGLERKKQIIVPLGLENCSKCPGYRDCVLFENNAQLSFSQKSVFYNCEKLHTGLQGHFVERIKQLKELGFSRFKIYAPTELNNLHLYQNYLIADLFKPEYALSVFETKDDIERRGL